MMFLLRTAFWLSVVLALLPAFAPRQSGTAPADLVAAEAVTAASATVADMSKFCDRRPDACAAGAQFVAAFGQRARAGAKIVYDFVGDRLGRPNGTGGEPDAKPSQNTLTSTDLAPGWRGPPARREAATKRST